jgi:hypothetical protein
VTGLTSSTRPRLTFGIYPGSAVGDTGPAGPPDRPDKISQALARLQGRSPQRQAEILRTVIDVIAGNAGALNITGYSHHTLRDARTAGSGIFCQFGLMTDDYVPKPAFQLYQDLISTLS